MPDTTEEMHVLWTKGEISGRTAGTTPEQRWVLGLASLASFMVILDVLVVAIALTAIRRHLGASLADLEWTVNAYTLSFAVLLMTAAAFGDRLGRRRVFAAGLAVFAVSSAACALAPDAAALIAARAVQGAGAATIMPMALALLNGAFPPARRGWAIGIYGSVTALAAVPGPVLGGAVTQGLGWRWIFWLNVPVALAAIPLVLHPAEGDRPAGRHGGRAWAGCWSPRPRWAWCGGWCAATRPAGAARRPSARWPPGAAAALGVRRLGTARGAPDAAARGCSALRRSRPATPRSSCSTHR